ncbi:hypothetical protein OE88DRAFT_1656324 [Heliocybe sulcata]|uniref:Fungal-type protein kinase domain-containing protein n=1 Tax=Heliocybe sulcata TaxID=5364 RepID=A0A5C3N8E7_9AGAM|nr:hypothetical protein OE88DRAFT_1656324 [Heliocybe sulcata]
MTILYRSSNLCRATDLSTASNTETLRKEVGEEMTRQLVATVAVSDFFGYAFPKQRHDAAVSNAYQNASDQAKAKVATLLNRVPTGEGREKHMYEPLINAINAICDVLWPTETPIVVQDSHSSHKGSPDLSFFSKNDSNITDKWHCGLGFVEVKAVDKEDPFHADERDPTKPLSMKLSQLNTWNQIQDYATRAFRSRARCSLVAIGVFGNYARLFRWDHSLAMVSRGFEYKKNSELLWQFIAYFGAPGYHGAGLDPTVGDYVELGRLAVPGLEQKYVRARDKNLLSPTVSVMGDDDLRKQSSVITMPSSSTDDEEKYITIGPPLFSSNAVLGRGTRTWLAVPVPGTVDHPERSNDDHFVIIKDSWRDVSRACEGDIYKEIYGDAGHAYGIARIRSDTDLYDPDRDDSDGSNDVHHTIAEWVSEFLGRRFRRRIHHRTIMDSVGIDLGRFKSTRDLLEGIRDAVKGHRHMSDKGILHRDISAYNVMLSAYPEKENGAKGFLIDMDYATVLGSKGSDDDLLEITGTTAFLSIARIEDDEEVEPHRKWNDLESFFWVTAYIVVRHAQTTYTVEKIVDLFDRGDAARRKEFIITKVHRIKFPPHPPLMRCLRNLAYLVASHYRGEFYHPDHLDTLAKDPNMFLLNDHQAFLDVIDKELKADDWPDPDIEAAPFVMAEPDSRKALMSMMQESVESTRRSQSQSKRKRDAETEASEDAEEENATKRARQEASKTNDFSTLPADFAGGHYMRNA